MFSNLAKAQVKKNAAPVKTHTKVVGRSFGKPQSINDVKDVLENNEAYPALKSLVEIHKITVVYADNSFLGNANLNRGDFVVSFNSVLDRIKDSTRNAGLDTTLINTYDRNKAYITSVTQVKDVQPGDVYYNSVQSLLENWGINAPFTKAGLLNASSLFYEDELYDILKVTLGFEYGNGRPPRVAVKRYRFAMILNDALNLKMQQIGTLANEKKTSDDAEKSKINAIIKQIEQNHRDSVSKEIELRKIEAEKKEAEARKKLDEKNK